MRAVPARLIADRDENVASVFDAFRLSLQDSQLRRIHLIIGRIDRHQRRFDALQFRVRDVIARGIEVIDHIVRVAVAQ